MTFRILAVLDLVLAAGGLVLSWTWFADAHDSPSSTAAIGLFLAGALAVPTVLALALAAGGVAVRRQRPAAGLALVSAATAILGTVAFGMAWLVVPW